eukprot:4753454-Amphidinium_carterae.2
MDINSCRTLPQTKKCKHCSRGTGYQAPQPSEVPEELRDLTPDTIAALRPVEIDCGHPASGEVRASDGYRVHVDVIRFRWHNLSVKNRVKKLPIPADRTKAKSALKYLLANETFNSYKKFYDMHIEFLAWYGEYADKKDRRLPVNFMESVGLENAAWPHSFTGGPTCVRATFEVKMCGAWSARPVHMEAQKRSAAAIFAKAEARRVAAKKRAVKKRPAAAAFIVTRRMTKSTNI